MKKIATILSFLFLLSQSGFSQGEFRFGFQASPSVSWLKTNSNKIDFDSPSLGLKLGVLGEYYFAEKYALVGGLGFAFAQGGSLTHQLEGQYWVQSEHAANADTLQAGTNLKYNLQFVEIPFALKMTTRYFGSIRFFAEIPRFTIGIKTQSRGEITGTTSRPIAGTPVSEEKIDIKKEIGGLNFSWGLGGGAEYEISESTAIVAGIFFQSGIFDMIDNKASFEANADGLFDREDSKATINAITLRIGVMF